MKLWLRSQLIDDTHIPDIVVDLIVASLYTSPQPYEVPALPQVGFFRFLQKMATSDWNVDPLVVNFNEELDGKLKKIHCCHMILIQEPDSLMWHMNVIFSILF